MDRNSQHTVSLKDDFLTTLDRFIGNMIVLFVVAAYFELFRFNLIPSTIRNLSQIIANGLMLVLIIIRSIYQTPDRIKMHFAVPVLLLILGSFPSYFVARYYHNQTFLISLYANRAIWFYLLYFFLHVYKIRVSYLVKVIIGVGLFAVALYYIQLVLYPKLFMDIVILVGRGTIRLFVAGLLCTQAAYFYYINRFFNQNRVVYLLFSMVTLSVFILQGTRQLIFALAFLTLINLFFSRQVKGRFVKIFILSLAFVAVFFIFREIFIELSRVSTSQAQNIHGGIRIKAARFFLTDFMPNGWAYLFGNSDSGTGSIYNERMNLFAFKYKFYISDIGIIGDYVKYGIIFTLAGIIMLVRAIRFRISPEWKFLKYYIFAQCFTLLTGDGILAGVDIIILIILYIFDVDRANKIQLEQTERNLKIEPAKNHRIYHG